MKKARELHAGEQYPEPMTITKAAQLVRAYNSNRKVSRAERPDKKWQVLRLAFKPDIKTGKATVHCLGSGDYLYG